MSGYLSAKVGRGLSTKLNGRREVNDFYPTPEKATRALLSVEQFSIPIWEPACGDGAMSKVLDSAGHTVRSTDLIYRGYGESARDFLLESESWPHDIITNPPFKLADEFARHALQLGCRKLALFARLCWLEGDRRHRTLWSVNPPSRVWVFSKRLTLWRGDDENAQTSGGAIAFAWYVWERGHSGPTIGWI